MHGKAINALPQIFWSDSTPWREANLWACQGATTREVHIKTVLAYMTALLAYANWLEENQADWADFPLNIADRCIVRFRGDLIDARDEGMIAPSTCTQRMRTVIQFYRWLDASGLISPTRPMWKERIIGRRITDAFGFERTIRVHSTNLAIRNRRRPGERLEDGLLPVSARDRDAILNFAGEHASKELFLMLACGFFTGMRVGTVTDLKIATLEHAVPDFATSNLYRLAVGPGAKPLVHTKFSVTGSVVIPKVLLDELKDYASSVRRLKRQSKVGSENRELLFLTRSGNPYTQRGTDKSAAINGEMSALRKRGVANNVTVLRHFRFHQSRCTFGTDVAGLAIQAGAGKAGNVGNAIALVMDLMLLKDEATAFRYIKFVEKTPAKIDLANAFTMEFLGLFKGRGRVPDA